MIRIIIYAFIFIVGCQAGIPAKNPILDEIKSLSTIGGFSNQLLIVTSSSGCSTCFDYLIEKSELLPPGRHNIVFIVLQSHSNQYFGFLPDTSRFNCRVIEVQDSVLSLFTGQTFLLNKVGTYPKNLERFLVADPNNLTVLDEHLHYATIQN